jgi:DnaD/phage-associated family protein
MRDLTIVGEAFQNGVKDVVSSHDSETLLALIEKYSVSQVLAAIEEAKKCKGHSAAYVKRVLEGWERDGKSPPGQSSGPDLMDPERYKNFGK